MLVIYSPVGGGHKAAALATAEAARARGLSVRLLDLFDFAPTWAGRTYVRTHLSGQRYAPFVYGKVYAAADRRHRTFDPLRRAVDRYLYGAIRETVDAFRPRVVVATHHLPLVVLGDERAQGRLPCPLVGVVTDYTGHVVWAEEGVDGLCVPCPRAYQELTAHGHASAKLWQTGIPVREGFSLVPNVRDPRDQEAVRVLVTSGTFGVGPLRTVLSSFAGMKNVELTVICGMSASEQRSIRALCATRDIPATVLGFERDMPSRMSNCHIVLGKAGGLTVSEALTAGRPLVLVGTVPGNESANLDFVLKAGAGVVSPAHLAGQTVASLVKASSLAAMGARGRSLVPPRSARKVVDTCMKIAGIESPGLPVMEYTAHAAE